MTPQRRFYKAQLDFIIAKLPLTVRVFEDESKTVTLVSLQGRHHYVCGENSAEYYAFSTDEPGVSYFVRSYKSGRDKFLIPRKLLHILYGNIGVNTYETIPDAPRIDFETLFHVARNPEPVTMWLLTTRKPFFRHQHPLLEIRLMSVIQAYVG